MASFEDSSSSSTDPYAQFYYWDPTANNWAFDYNAYYASYGYPSDASGAGGSSYPGVSSYGSSELWPNQPPDYSQIKQKRAKHIPGPKDAQGNAIAGKLRRGETRQTVLRKGVGNSVYEDQTLMEWDPAHKRLFVGDLGNDVSDATLSQAFEKYPSFSKARVVRNKGDGKSKGYGFVAFADPHDFLKAWKEMNGKYIGSRPCRLKKANEDVGITTIGARKDKLLAAQSRYDEYKAKNKMGGAVGSKLRRHGIGKAWGQK